MRHSVLNIGNLQVAAFDWDNTLAFSRENLQNSVNEILKEYGLPSWDKVCEKRNPRLSFADNFPLIFGAFAEEAYQKYCAVYLQNIPQYSKAQLKARETVMLLREKGIKTVIITNKTRNLLEAELAFLYDKNLFDNAVCGHEAARDKPYPEQLLFAVKPYVRQISPQTVWMIGDSPLDSDCALSAGACAIRIGESIWHDKEKKDSRVIYFSDFPSFYEELKGQ